jgi:hypothetical protein
LSQSLREFFCHVLVAQKSSQNGSVSQQLYVMLLTECCHVLHRTRVNHRVGHLIRNDFDAAFDDFLHVFRVEVRQLRKKVKIGSTSSLVKIPNMEMHHYYGGNKELRIFLN